MCVWKHNLVPLMNRNMNVQSVGVFFLKLLHPNGISYILKVFPLIFTLFHFTLYCTAPSKKFQVLFWISTLSFLVSSL